MRNLPKTRLASVLCFCLCVCASAAHGKTLSETAALKYAEAERQNTTVVRGADGWLFFAPELRSVSAGVFWGERAPEVSRAEKPEYADPLPAILDFQKQLKAASIRLIIVPVPAKAAVYPDKLSPELKPYEKPSEIQAERKNDPDRRFYDLLEKNGVEVLDLTPVFWEERQNAQLYCKQDTHWSGAAVEIAAREIANAVGKPDWAAAVEKRTYETTESETQIEGDLWKALKDPAAPKESLPLKYIRAGKDRESPVLLLGDSHCLVFHDGGDMHAKGAGLPDHLAAQLDFPVDLAAVRGSGATPARIALLRRRDNLRGKRVVVWCFSVREFTESAQGWRKVPVIR